jgi:hypothetical protein
MKRDLRNKTLNCVHCGTPQTWPSQNAARCICPDCVAGGNAKFPRDEQTELQLEAAAQ